MYNAALHYKEFNMKTLEDLKADLDITIKDHDAAWVAFGYSGGKPVTSTIRYNLKVTHTRYQKANELYADALNKDNKK
jgi:hypothetical protein